MHASLDEKHIVAAAEVSIAWHPDLMETRRSTIHLLVHGTKGAIFRSLPENKTRPKP